jgi:hypothetical protein
LSSEVNEVDEQSGSEFLSNQLVGTPWLTCLVSFSDIVMLSYSAISWEHKEVVGWHDTSTCFYSGEQLIMQAGAKINVSLPNPLLGYFSIFATS